MITKEQFNKTVSANLIKYRKYHGITQASLAEKLNYSDKAVAKWESGESLPEAFVLNQIAEIYGITLNDLLSTKKRVKAPASKVRAFFIPALSCCVVWLVALVSFISLLGALPDFNKPWLTFIYAVPVTFIVVLVFSCIYKNKLTQFISISGIIWTVIMSIHLSLIEILPIVSTLYVIGIPIQIAFILWYLYIFIIKNKKRS